MRVKVVLVLSAEVRRMRIMQINVNNLVCSLEY